MRLSSDPYDGQRPYEVVRKLVETRDWDGVIGTLKTSGLVGMGGAGFPAGIKWEAAKNAIAQPKYVVCNADESEPGTIKDRFIMTHLPHLMIEGMIVAGLVTSAKKGYIYLRHEYEEQEHVIREELARCYKAGLLGRSILGSDLTFDLELFMSPGGYICGESSALLEALEGKRAEPRNKPPNATIEGLWKKPTTLNNVETFVYVVGILANGPDWFKGYGKNGSFGLKFVGVTGHVKNPGVFEVPMGTTYRELVYEYAGGPPGDRKVVGFAPSGPSSGYLPPDKLDLPLDFKTVSKAGSMVGSAAIVVCAEGTCMLDMALNSVKFFRNESCGKCVPCRVGSQKMVDMLTGWTKGDFKDGELGLLEELSHALKTSSICGLGQILPAPIQSVIQHFRPDVDEHILNKRCPAGVCFS
jgi:NADH:ubiquinone oxidoreductase subunit F (NADH-binding)